ncbi:TonB-dependent siderophore receptor [Pseudoalteromonas sp. MMG012]|uniref:TonB-dependent receptor plug domain-containing protein n=1 Tax=Pseudoalteromonas sp. MMG012 TaxID=2822686 RepID=UPI001B3A625D|nr:TonB-dependent receptor [Pseudoalteromonas sp. MMG012]MBQ4851791.1 TonB-dependent receptor [Pseudoalteromonas sp. MMG012]
MINSDIQPPLLFKRSALRQAILSCVLMGGSCTLIGFSNVSAANESAANIDRYEARTFMALDPQTLYDILENTPGANSLLNALNDTSENRGFGSAGEQILINSKRMSGKENSLAKELDSIQAQDVDYIELIRGTRSDLDVQSNGLVINVVLKKDIDPSILWTLGTVKTADIKPYSRGSLTYSASIDNFKYRLGMSHSVNPTEISSSEYFTSIDQVHTQTNTRVRDNIYTTSQLSAKLEYVYSDKTSMQLNGIYEKIKVDATISNDGEYLVKNTQEHKALVYDWARDKWEISGDISHEYNDDHQLKLLFISNRADSDDKIGHSVSKGGNILLPDYTLPRIYTSKENVLRTNWRYKLNTRHTFDSGFEVAINELNEDLQFIRQSGVTYRSTELNDIKETRYEAFSNYNFAMSAALNLQSSLIYERSTIDVATDLLLVSDTLHSAQSDTSRTFNYLKPRLNLRYDLNEIYQMRFNYQRTVSQLELKDFVPWFDSYESRLEEANPDLKPEVRDELSFAFEKQWQNTNGSFTVTPYYHKVSDLINEVLLAKRSGDGNIDRAKEYGVKLETNFGLEALGLNNTLVSANYTWRESDVVHPFTGERGPIERVSKNEWHVKLNQNDILPGLSLSLTLEDKSRYEFYYYDYQGNVDTKITANAFIDYQMTKNLKLRLKGDNLLNDRYTVNKARHTALFTDSDFLRQERRDNERAPRFSLILTGQF